MEEILSAQVVLDGQQRATVTLEESGLLRWRGAKQQGQLLVRDDLIGFRASSSSGCKLHLHAFQMTESTAWCGKGVPGRKRKEIVVEFDTEAALQRWCEAIQRILDESGRPKRLFVLVNPIGGEGSGRRVFTTTVEPLLKTAGVSFTMQETEYQRHGKDLAQSFDHSQFDGIVCVSGDGVLVEVLNGLLERSDWKEAIKTPIGIVPAGTGNGMAKSLLDHVGEPCDAASATFLVIRGQKQPLDVATAKQDDVKFHSILMMAWGLVADVDFESERWRWLGALRLDVYSLIRIINLRKYVGHIYYIPAPGYEGTGTAFSEEVEGAPLLKPHEGNDGKAATGHSGSSYPGPGPAVANPEAWRGMEGPFINVWLNNVPFAAETLNSAPHAKFADGYLDLVIMKDCPSWTLLRLLTKLQTGGHIRSKYVQYLKVKAFRLDPAGRYGSDIQGGYIDVDGEILARGRGTVGDSSQDIMAYGPPVEVTVEQGLATVFCPASA